jgi:hypothetical protein
VSAVRDLTLAINRYCEITAASSGLVRYADSCSQSAQ